MSPSSTSDGTTTVRRALLIVNPAARRGTRAHHAALAAFDARGVSYKTFITESSGHAGDLARTHAAGFDAVFTLGGDGTAMEVIAALAESGPPVGILAGGTGNILARALGIPLRVSRAVPALLSGAVGRMDLGRLDDGRHFAIGLGVGLDEAMIAGASPMMKKRVGVLAYVWSALRAGLRLEQFRVRLIVDGAVYEREAASVLVANIGTVLGGLIQLGQGIVHDDGLLHACIYSPRNLREALRLFARMLRGRVHLDERALCISGREIRLETDPPRRAQADGEVLAMTPFNITVRPGAARILIPK